MLSDPDPSSLCYFQPDRCTKKHSWECLFSMPFFSMIIVFLFGCIDVFEMNSRSVSRTIGIAFPFF